jgi:hypothetical protein
VARYKLRRPCEGCPFRTDVPGYLRRERAQEIAEDLANGSEFACHKTTVSDEEFGGDGSERVATQDSAFCAGALITMERSGQANQIMRVAERLGLYEHEKLDMYAPVHESLFAFVQHHGDPDEVDEDECCSVVEDGCHAPAGMLLGGFVVPAERTGPLHECPECGQPVCDACSDDTGLCTYCADRG